jgi:transcriptional regulator with XRE-family HTH domain
MLSTRLKELRATKQISQAELSNILGVTQQAVGKWERDKTTPDYETLKKIASFFNVTTDYLLGNDTPTSSTLPPLTPKDERKISKDLEDMIHSLSGSAVMGNPEDEEDLEMLKASLKQAMMLSKRIAKKKFTPKKYRKE